MSDGGAESAKHSERSSTGRKPRNDDFAHEIARIAVAQVCEGAGFQSFQHSALDTLSDVAVRYIREIGKTSNYYANLAGRTESNVFDIIQGLEDFGSGQGFSAASDVDHCLAGSGTVVEISQYVEQAEEIPFAYSLPQFPVIKERKLNPSFEQLGGTPPSEHIPPWLPVFPDPDTYASMPSGNETENIQMDKVDQTEENKKVEGFILSSEQRLAQVAVDAAEIAKAKRAVDSNPFLSKPVQFGEKEVSTLVPPAKLLDEEMANNPSVENHASIMETFAPAIEAVKSRPGELEEGRKKLLMERRPTVQFKLGIRQKSSTHKSLQNEDTGKTASWFGNDSGKDERKRRAEQILRESMDNTREFSQL